MGSIQSRIGRDSPKRLRDFGIPSSLHPSINTVEDLKSVLPDLEIESSSSDRETTYPVDAGSSLLILSHTPLSEIQCVWTKRTIFSDTDNTDDAMRTILV